MTQFSYDLVLPLIRGPYSIYFNLPWNIIEKGTIQSRWRKFPYCYNTLYSAKTILESHISEPTYHQVPSFPNDGDNTVYLLQELQYFQSVKERGVIYTLLTLTEEQKLRGVITISTGTFGHILCYYGNRFDIPVTVVMPSLIANDFVKKCQDTGPQATVLVHGPNMIEAHRMALYIAATRGLFYLDGNDHPNMIIGQSTLSLEMMNEIDVVILPTSFLNCALTAGIAAGIKAINRNIIVIEVVCNITDCLFESIREVTMLHDELKFPVKNHSWQGISAIFDHRTSITFQALRYAFKVLNRVHVYDMHTGIGLAAFVSGNLNWLKQKRVLIPLFGLMDSMSDLMHNMKKSNLSEPSAGPSTSYEQTYL